METGPRRDSVRHFARLGNRAASAHREELGCDRESSSESLCRTEEVDESLDGFLEARLTICCEIEYEIRLDKGAGADKSIAVISFSNSPAFNLGLCTTGFISAWELLWFLVDFIFPFTRVAPPNSSSTAR